MAASDKGVKERVQQYRDRVQMLQYNDGSKKFVGDDDDSDCGEADHGPCPEQLMTSPFFTSGDDSTARASSWTNRWHEEEKSDVHEAHDDDDDDDLWGRLALTTQVTQRPSTSTAVTAHC